MMLLHLMLNKKNACVSNNKTQKHKIQNANENCSTYLVLSLFIIIENTGTPIFVFWGMSSWVCFHSDKVLPIYTAWVLLVRKH